MSLVRICFLLALFVSGCADPEPRTQLTFEIDASERVRSQTALLRVLVTSDLHDNTFKDFSGDDLEWPVQIVLVPQSGNDAMHNVTVTVSARDQAGAILGMERTGRGTFVPRQNVSIELQLDTPDPMPSDGGPDAEPDPGPADGGTEDTDAARPTCATPGSGITCDAGSRCNGILECQPENPDANREGCFMTAKAVVCPNDQRCVDDEGEEGFKCSPCGADNDGDDDDEDSKGCGGDDCDDADRTVHPGAPELCDGKDNDCDGKNDAEDTDAMTVCMPMAPDGGTARCDVATKTCVPQCPTGTKLEAGKCVPIMTVNACMPNPCGVGNTCVPMGAQYSCMCATGSRFGAGTTCAVQSIERPITFDTTCTGAANAFPATGMLTIEPALYAPCGVASITHGTMAGPTQLTKLTGTDGAVLVGGTSTLLASSQLVLTFGSGVKEFSFDVLDIDTLLPVTVTTVPPAPAGTLTVGPVAMKRAAVTYKGATPITSVTISYPLGALASDVWYVDDLTFPSKGCGDGVVDMAAGETCDDANNVQCDTCDNACRAPAAGACPAPAPTAPGPQPRAP